MRAIPPMQDLFAMAGMELPKYLGQNIDSEVKTVKEESPKKEEKAPEKKEVKKEK
jgi:flotillin